MEDVAKVEVELGTVRSGHGVTFHVFFKQVQADKRGEWFLDVSAPTQMWNNLPFGASSAADFILPLKCYPSVRVDHNGSSPRSVFTFTLGAKQLSHQTLLKSLRNQILGGDPPIRFEFLFRPVWTDPLVPQFHVIFRCSRVLLLLTSSSSSPSSSSSSSPPPPPSSSSSSSTSTNHKKKNNKKNNKKKGKKDDESDPDHDDQDNHQNNNNNNNNDDADDDRNALCRDNFPLETFPTRGGFMFKVRRAIKLVSWLAGPVVWMLVCMLLLAWPQGTVDLLQQLPSWAALFWHSKQMATVRDLMPPVPHNLHSAFLLGQIAQKLLGGTLAQGEQEQLLAAAGQLVDRDQQVPLTTTELQLMPQVLLQLSQEQGLVSRLLGLLTLVNMVWLLSIIVATVSFAPAVYFTLTPLSKLLRRLCLWCWRRLIKPTARWCHEWGVFASALWALAFVTLGDAAVRVPLSAQLYLALTAVAVTGLATAYSTLLFGLGFLRSWSPAQLRQLVGWWAVLFLAPLALAFSSTLLGFLASGVLLLVLGFHVSCGHLCWMIGFEKDEVVRCAAACWMLLMVYSAAKVALGYLGCHALLEHIIAVFGLGVGVLGSLGLLLALLGYAADFPHPHFSYLRRNLLMWGALIQLSIIGAILLPSSGILPTCQVFWVLYFVEKYMDLHIRARWNAWLLVFILAVITYHAAVFVHSHPQIIVDLFSG